MLAFRAKIRNKSKCSWVLSAYCYCDCAVFQIECSEHNSKMWKNNYSFEKVEAQELSEFRRPLPAHTNHHDSLYIDYNGECIERFRATNVCNWNPPDAHQVPPRNCDIPFLTEEEKKEQLEQPIALLGSEHINLDHLEKLKFVP